MKTRLLLLFTAFSAFPLFASEIVYLGTPALDPDLSQPEWYGYIFLKSKGVPLPGGGGYVHEWNISPDAETADVVEILYHANRKMILPIPFVDWPLNVKVNTEPLQNLDYFIAKFDGLDLNDSLYISGGGASDDTGTTGDHVLFTVSPENVSLEVSDNHFIQPIEIYNNSGNINFQISENSANLRLASTALYSRKGDRKTFYVYGTAYQSGSATVSITGAGITKTVRINWNVKNAKTQPNLLQGLTLEHVILDLVDTNFDDVLSDAEISEVTSLDLRGYGLTSIEGIAVFHNLKNLDVSHNQLEQLPNLAPLTQLKTLNLEGNPLQALPASMPTSLEWVASELVQ